MRDTAASFTYRFALRVADETGSELNVRVSGKEAVSYVYVPDLYEALTIIQDTFLNNLPAKEVVENGNLLSQRLKPLLGHLYDFHDSFAEERKNNHGPWLDLVLYSYTINDSHIVYYKLTGCSLVNNS